MLSAVVSDLVHARVNLPIPPSNTDKNLSVTKRSLSNPELLTRAMVEATVLLLLRGPLTVRLHSRINLQHARCEDSIPFYTAWVLGRRKNVPFILVAVWQKQNGEIF